MIDTNIRYKIAQPLLLSGTGNTRELGNYCGKDGRKIKMKKLLRSDSIHQLTEGDKQILRDYGLGCIIDLRSEQEVVAQPCSMREDGIDYYHMPMADGLQSNSLSSANRMADIYIQLLDNYGLRFIEVMRIIAAHSHCTVLFHCAVGKDRTGLMAMLLLLMVGVPFDTVIADYCVSEINMKEIFNTQYKLAVNAGIYLPEFAFRSNQEEMILALAHLIRKWGGCRGYLNAHGFSDREITDLQEKLLH
ncbi:MAG: tyrosine-protein phosphatase [Lachnospiraceae bacterium]